MHKTKLNNLTTNNNTTTAFNTSTTTSSLSPNSSTTSSSLTSLNNTTTDDLQHSLQSHQRHQQRAHHHHHQHRQYQKQPKQQQQQQLPQQTSTSILNSSIASIDLEQYIEAMEARSTASERNPEADVWAQLQQKESDILLAAELGQALLEENQELKKKLEKEIKENSAKIEVSQKLQYDFSLIFLYHFPRRPLFA
ncbi:basic-leucine zipper transcription factor A [Lucilia sericata]|uniref:basic-leucine zipper transcription factor A n=1 Tax=Lucilia sericata TaxID=13632 RepID=UPI0018A8613A|nr:basic-leucine zipper transcription factor A [Lucilia sericata]